MKRDKHIKEAELIGKESFALLHFGELSADASLEQQASALKRDQHWQELHHTEVSARIDKLIQDIEFVYPL